jgi:hypothetical protein
LLDRIGFHSNVGQKMEIPVADVAKKIDEQKLLALQTPILIIAGGPAADGTRPHADGLSAVFNNPSLFSFIAPEDAETALAAAIQHTAVFFFYRSKSIYQEAWFETAIVPNLASIPGIDLFKINLTTVTPADEAILKTLDVQKPPCVLVYRMGHRIHKILPETENQSIIDTIAEYRQGLRELVAEPIPRTPEDAAREARAFEKRERERFAQEQQKQREESVLERAAALRRVAEEKERRRKGV